MNPQKTYQLTVSFLLPTSAGIEIKEEVKAYLVTLGVSSYVEGSIDELDIDHEYEQVERDFYQELGGDHSPIHIYSYHQEYLLDLKAKLEQAFGDQLECQLAAMDTSVWMEGWKESFKPIKTKRFYIYPPWDEQKTSPGKISLEIDPGMAFGTGQHATTQVCLRQLESLFDDEQWPAKKLLDVGTGSGILAIAAKKLGCGSVEACDIEIDAVAAAQENSRKNGVSLHVWQGSLPSPSHSTAAGAGGYDVVVANILFVVLAKLIKALASELKTDGRLILSGLLAEQKEAMLELARQQRLELLAQAEQDGWVALILGKKP